MTRKEFLAGSTAFAGAVAMPNIVGITKKSINVALIGCGERGKEQRRDREAEANEQGVGAQCPRFGLGAPL